MSVSPEASSGSPASKGMPGRSDSLQRADFRDSAQAHDRQFTRILEITEYILEQLDSGSFDNEESQTCHAESSELPCTFRARG